MYFFFSVVSRGAKTPLKEISNVRIEDDVRHQCTSSDSYAVDTLVKDGAARDEISGLDVIVVSSSSNHKVMIHTYPSYFEFFFVFFFPPPVVNLFQGNLTSNKCGWPQTFNILYLFSTLIC